MADVGGAFNDDAFWEPGFFDIFESGFYPLAFWEPGFVEVPPVSTTTTVNAWWAIQMEFSGTGNGWTDVTADVRSEEDLAVQYGISGITATDRVAGTGTLIFTLNNGPTNSARMVGYYSPDNANRRAGFTYGIRVRLALTYTPVGTIYRFLGTLDQLLPTAGVRGRYLTKCVVVDWMDEASRFHLTGLALQTNVTGDHVFSTVVSSMPIQPAAIETTVGLDTYPFALDNVQDESTTAMSVFQALAMSELGYIFIKSDPHQGGTLTYESRSIRGAKNTIVQTFSNTMEDVKVERARHNLLNKVQVTAHPRKIDAAATTVLFTLNSGTLVTGNTTLALNAPFRDPTQPLARVGCASLTPPVATTDYTMNTVADGSGTDVTSHFTVTVVSSSGNSANLLVTNNGTDGYLTKLQLRGQGIYDYNTTVSTAQDANSQLNVGQRVINVDMPYQSDPRVGNEAAQYILNVWSNQLSYVTNLTILGNWRDALMQAVMLRDISDCVSLDESVTGVKSTIRYFVNGVSLKISQGRVFRMTFVLAPADQGTYWLLEVVGSGELGIATRPGYGLIVGHVDVAHADSHDDVTHVDVAHDDTHGDVAHVDVLHGDDAHSDTAHTDTHTDSAHGDVSHVDTPLVNTAHNDAHGDIAHSDVAFISTPHSDSHSDNVHGDTAHSDVAHTDSHSDVVHADAHSDFTDHGDNGLPPSNESHVDASTHDDSHTDTAHSDDITTTAHADTPHADTAHADSHSDVNHGDIAHIDAAHTDTHTDIAHGDALHGDDFTHTDLAHGDVGHVDIAHVDVAHNDITAISSAHVDTHTDSAHSDVTHVDTHNDTAHGDKN